MSSPSSRSFSASHLDFPGFPPEIIEEGQSLGEHIMGATVVAWLAGEPLNHWGERWLHGGTWSLRFRRHLTVGDHLTLKVTTSPDEQLYSLTDDKGNLCADGAAHLLAPEDWPTAPHGPTPLPTSRLDPATQLVPGADLGSVSLTFDTTRHSSFFANLDADDPWRRRTDTHPAWLISTSNALVRRSIAFERGLFAQAGVTLFLLEPIPSGSQLVVQGTVIEQFSKRPREFVSLRFTLSVGDVLHAIVDQTIAY